MRALLLAAVLLGVCTLPLTRTTERAMRRLALALAFAALASAAAAQGATPVQNRANAAVSGTPNLQIASAAAQPDLCTGVQTAAYGTPMLAVTVSAMRRDPECSRIRKAKALQGLGYPAAGVQLLCQDRDVHAAMQAAGTRASS